MGKEPSANSYQLSAKQNTKKGFTLIELLVAITIIAIISAFGITVYASAQKSGRDSKRKEDLKAIATAMQLYYSNNNRFPPGLPAATNVIYSSDAANWSAILSNQYIGQMPTDPINNAASAAVSPGASIANFGTANTSYSYGYYAIAAPGTGCPGVGQFYALFARLENTADSDRVGARDNKWCDGLGLFSTYTWSPNLYVITSQ